MNDWTSSLGNIAPAKFACVPRELARKERARRCRELRLSCAKRQKERAYRDIGGAMRKGMPYGTQEIADALGRRSEMAVRQRLEEMAETGMVEKIVETGYGGRPRFLWRVHENLPTLR